MPSTRQFLQEGLDPTGLACISAADLLQMFRASLPAADIGYVIQSETTPDVVTYPELEQFVWIKPSTGESYVWNGSWALAKTNVSIPNASITSAKLSPSGGNAGDILQVDPSVTYLGFISIVNAVTNDTFPVGKLVKGSNGTVLVTKAGAISWETNANFWADLITAAPNGSIPVAKVAGGGTSTPTGPAGGDLSGTYPNPILGNSGAVAGSYGGAGIPVSLSVDAKGRITTIANATGMKVPTAKLYYETTAGTDGVVNTAGNRVVNLNNSVDPEGIVTLVANAFTLAPGTYEIEGIFPFSWAPGSGTSRILVGLYNITSAGYVDWAYDVVDADTDGDYAEVCLKGIVFTIAVNTQYEFRWTKVGTNPDYNFWAAVSAIGTFTERHNQVVIRKIA